MAASQPPGEITLLLNRPGGEKEKCARLADLVFADLRRIANHVMDSERSNVTLQATAVATDAYLKLVDRNGQTWESRRHFFAAAARTMRLMLVDHGRKRRALKRGGDVQRVCLDEVGRATDLDLEDLLALDQALARLEKRDKKQLEVVELRYFAGLTEEEVAEVMGLSPRTVKREWAVARLFLLAELTRPRSNSSHQA